MSTRDVSFPAKDEPLREDVGLLGDLVGQVIREQEGDKLFQLVETARHAAIRRREGVAGAAGDLEEKLYGLSAREGGELVRAFSAYFQVVNIAERVHRIRRGRAWMRGPEPQHGSLEDTLRRLREMGVGPARAIELFADSRVEPVFTAHPTESTRRSILDKQERIARQMIARLAPERTPREERVALARIREDITAAWQTEEHPSERPTVASEREHVLYYVIQLYRVLPALHEQLDDALGTSDGTGTAEIPPLVRPGSWVGGDMDGNPNVNARTVRETLRRHRELALRAYAGELAELAEQLTQSDTRVAWSEEVSELIRRYSAMSPEALTSIEPRHRGMGYRVLLTLMRARLVATLEDEDRGYEGPESFLADVEAIAASLAAHRGLHAGLFGVRRLARRVRAFGFHLAALDVRQDARHLREVVAELLDDEAWPTRPAEARAERLRGDLLRAREVGTGDVSDAGTPGAGPVSPLQGLRARLEVMPARVVETLDVFRAIAECRARYGANAIGSYIVSMAEDVDDLLAVRWLASVAGLDTDEENRPFDVCPLFETVRDLEGAADVLERVLTDPVLGPDARPGGRAQLVMVGYSDSNKDGGVASARWALHQALERMAEVAARRAVTLTVFHGRGGTVSRGGGAIHRAVAAMPAASIGNRLRLTEQGEVIDATYGLPEIALRNLERMLGAIVLRAAGEGGDGLSTEWRALADTVSAAARKAYRALVYENPRFGDYFRAGTPIDVIERMSIGSRPARRRAAAGVEDLRAIPWVFSWTQCRAMLPGWYGLGAGLEAARREHGLALLREAAAGWPFFDVLLGDVEMVLAKADLEIAALYRPLAPEESHDVFRELHAEYQRTVSLLLEIRGNDDLLEGDPTLQRSIRLRNPYVDPMNILQVDLLRRWREEGRPTGPLLDALLSTINGIARGLQNTG